MSIGTSISIAASTVRCSGTGIFVAPLFRNESHAGTGPRPTKPNAMRGIMPREFPRHKANQDDRGDPETLCRNSATATSVDRVTLPPFINRCAFAPALRATACPRRSAGTCRGCGPSRGRSPGCGRAFRGRRRSCTTCCRNPTSRATTFSSSPVSHSSSTARLSRTRTISLLIERPTALRNLRSSTLRDSGTWRTTSSTPMPSQAWSRTKRIARTIGLVLDRHDVGRRPPDDARRLDVHRLGGRRLAADQAVEHGGGLVAALVVVDDHAGQRREARSGRSARRCRRR